MMNEPGTKVFVRWYGKTLQGEVVPDDHRVPLFASMLHVRIPVQGTPVIAVFSPAHVYVTAADVPAASPAIADVPATSLPGSLPVNSSAPPSPTWSTLELDAHRARYRQFKADHWDHEHNHIRVDALEEFYHLFRKGVALRRGYQEPSPIVSVDIGSPDGDRSATIIVDTVTDENLPELPKKATVPAGSPAAPIPNPTKKQLRSTGRIQYRDTIQTSLFD